MLKALQRLEPGQKIRITHTVRVGSKSWQAVVQGTFREVRSLVTGLATERHPADQIIVPTVHFTKPNGELSSVSLDQHTVIEVLPAESA
jgi:hypothetical protein